MSLGVLLPGVLLGAAAVACCDRITIMILQHPLETLTELALALMVPVANYVVWKSLSRDDRRFCKASRNLNGASHRHVFNNCRHRLSCRNFFALPAIDESSGNPHPGAFTSIALIATFAAAVSVCLANSSASLARVAHSQLRTVAYAANGTIAFFLGCSPSDPNIPRLTNFLGTIGSKVIPCGGPSLGLAAKLSNNYLSGIITIACSEAMDMGMRAGIGPDMLASVFRSQHGSERHL